MAGRHARINPIATILRFLLILALAFLLLWPLIEPHTLQVEQTTVTISTLPATVGQLKIVYCSDIHLGNFPFFTKSQLNSLVRKINSLAADIVILGGDYADNTEEAISFFLQLPSIRANYGVYAVLGENDREDISNEASSQLRAAMIAAGVTPLINSVANIRIGKNDIYLAGLDDIANGTPRLSTLASSVSQDDFVVFVCHNPAIISEAMLSTDSSGRINWFDLGLFGHTHGGQVPLVSSLLGLSEDDRCGWLSENRIPMLISKGIGTKGLPIRFFRSPTIHVIDIRSK